MSIKFMIDGSTVFDGDDSEAIRAYQDACVRYDAAHKARLAALEAYDAAEAAYDEANRAEQEAEQEARRSRTRLLDRPQFKVEKS
jgi:hypothetical protein